MPLQNRVDPFGNILAVPERGTLLGNRGGRFHCDERTLGNRRWSSRHWICCELHFKGLHHEPMGNGYTSLFFLDEVTALAAGHRPCFFCRRAEAKSFLWAVKADSFDRILHDQRLSLPLEQDLASLPDATMVADGGAAFAIRRGRLLHWSFGGYTRSDPIMAGQRAKVLTRPAITAILAAGYQPRWHASAEQWG